MTLNLEHLQALLNDAPSSSSFTQSVELLEDAFDYTRRKDDNRPRWGHYRSGEDVEFFGERTLRALLGDDFRDELDDRRDYWDDTATGGPRSRVRLELQRYAVIGRRGGHPGAPACVLFHSGQVSFSAGLGPPDEKVRPFELVRIRAGLMNRRQALLLANHLNRFRRSGHHGEPLAWSIVRGPGPDSSARLWFDGVAGKGLHLRHTVGDLPSWGLRQWAAHAVEMYVVEPRRPAHREQVFTYGTARYLPPLRFAISAVEKMRSHGVPKDKQWSVTRATECEEAYSVAEACEQAGLIGNDDEYVLNLGDFWGPKQDGNPWDGPAYTPSPAVVYATSFSRDEALRVMRTLRASGYRSVGVRRVGADGNYCRWETGNPYFAKQEIHVLREIAVAGAPEFTVHISTFLFVQERHTPFESREEWEKEALTAAWQQEKAPDTDYPTSFRI